MGGRRRKSPTEGEDVATSQSILRTVRAVEEDFSKVPGESKVSLAVKLILDFWPLDL